MPNTTTYVVKNAEGEIVAEGISKKAKAVAQAEALKASTRKTHRVYTGTGTMVHEVKGVRAMKKTPRYTRTVALPEGVVAPEGARVAYLRKRHDSAILAFDTPEGHDYRILRLSSGELEPETFDRTRDAGKRVLDFSAPEKEPVAVEA